MLSKLPACDIYGLFKYLSSIDKNDKFILISNDTYEFLKSQVQQYIVSDVEEFTTMCGIPIVIGLAPFGFVYVLNY